MTNKYTITKTQCRTPFGHCGLDIRWSLVLGHFSSTLCWSLVLGHCCIGCTKDNITRTGQHAALDSFDLTAMTDDMAMKIAADPEVLSEFKLRGPLKVVVRPVENHLTGEVLPRGEAMVFTARVRALLGRHAPRQFTWIMNRDAYYDLRKRELEGIELGPAPEAIDPQFALTATFSSLTDENAKRRSAYYLCVYELTDLSGRTLLWSDKYEVKKVAVKGDFE